MVRTALVISVLLACLGGIGYIFWRQELQYSLPTPVPKDYKTVAVGDTISLPSSLQKQQAYFLHFYNPQCPCSRFNAQHIKSLIRNYNGQVKFVIIVPTNEAKQKAASEFGGNLTIFIDAQETIAQACGVYSTPQAAIVDVNGKLFYRGNYNASRYCTTKATNFAELSLVALLNHQPAPAFSLLATQSYGCELGKQSDLVLF